MQFNVAHLLQGSVGTTQRYDLSSSLTPLRDTQTDHVWGRLRIMRVDVGVWLSGLLQADAFCVCSRCLGTFSQRVSFQLEQVYHSIIDVFSGAAVPSSEDADLDFTIDDHHTVDITEAVRQSIIVCLPMKPLCYPECAGLCPGCGANLNLSSCACRTDNIDPRWAPLLGMTSRCQV